MEKVKIGASDQFRRSAENLANNTSYLLKLEETRNDAAIMVGKLEGLLLGAKAELKVREEALVRSREILAPQAEFFLSSMEREANDNLALIRSANEHRVAAGG